MPVPKKRRSKSRIRSRYAQQRIRIPTLVRCARCRQLKLPHHVCLTCGHYQGRQVVKTDTPS